MQYYNTITILQQHYDITILAGGALDTNPQVAQIQCDVFLMIVNDRVS